MGVDMRVIVRMPVLMVVFSSHDDASSSADYKIITSNITD